jgi:hypothetical protein
MEIPDLEGRADPVVFAKLGSVEDFFLLLLLLSELYSE